MFRIYLKSLIKR